VIVAAVVLSAAATISPRAASAESQPKLAKQPNIILIMADDLGYGELGCYGQELIRTPRIDELARQGMRFTQFYAGSPVCASSRCTLMTGKHTGHAAIRNNMHPKGLEKLREKHEWETPGQQPLPDSEVTIAELLRANRFETAAIGKWGLGMPGTSGDPNRQGFDLFYGFVCQTHAHNHYPKFLWRNGEKETLPGNDGSATGETFSQDRFIAEAKSFIRGRHDRPFFLYLPFTIPHLSLQVPEKSRAEYAGQLPETPYEHKDNYFPHPTPHAAYAAMISHMDAGIGEIIDLLDELNLGENTLVMFTSDNGPTHGRLGGSDSAFFKSAGPLRGLKGSTYEGGIRVPFIARWPGKIAPGRETDQVAAHWDVLPTICDIARVQTPQSIDGISILPTLLGSEGQKQHKYLYWEFPAYGMQQAIRVGNWKAVRAGVDRGDPAFELYDLSQDIGETTNVAEANPEVVAKLAKFAAAAHTASNLFPLFEGERRTHSKEGLQAIESKAAAEER